MSNAKVRYFDLGDILSVTTGLLVSPRHMEGVYDILDFLSGDQNFTHQLPRVSRECAPWVLKQHPQLAEISSEGIGRDNWQPWLTECYAKYGKELPLTPMPREMHTAINPLEELAAMMGDKKKIIVVTPEAL